MPNLIDKSITTIIITDDNPVDVKIIKTMLDKEGYRTATATDGAKCIDETKKLKPNLILLDINMPGMNGLEVCKVIKQDQQARNTPVIFVTANTDDETLKEAFESGGTDYICKPVNRMELLARIKATLAQKELMEGIMKEEKLKGILEMAGSICHEMNQPMMSISGYSELLLMDISEENPLYGKLSMIKVQVDRMAEITRKLMRITRYETGDYLKGKIIDINRASKETE